MYSTSEQEYPKHKSTVYQSSGSSRYSFRISGEISFQFQSKKYFIQFNGETSINITEKFVSYSLTWLEWNLLHEIHLFYQTIGDEKEGKFKIWTDYFKYNGDTWVMTPCEDDDNCSVLIKKGNSQQNDYTILGDAEKLNESETGNFFKKNS